MTQQQTGQTLAEYLTVSEAAEFLGVSPWTLRNWDKAGRLRPLRHPKNGYRIYRQEELARILELEGVGPGALEKLSPQVDWRAMNPGEHFVQFYENDAFLVDAVCGFIGSALVVQEGALVIATPEHRAAIEDELKRRGLDLKAARNRGQYVALDAADLLSKFMVDGMPDVARFMAVAGDMISGLKRGRRRVRAFGEMVAILWRQGNRAAALRLEEIWNELNRDQSFTLFCAYPVDGTGSEEDSEIFEQICTCHSHVVPAESYAGLGTAQDRLREITRLQHKAQALEQAKVRAEEANKAKDQFLAVLSHELRTPLTPVVMAVTELENDLTISASVREDLGMIRRNIALETRLIDDLLDLSRALNGKMNLAMQDVNLHPLIRSVAQMVGLDARPKQLRVDLELGAARDRICGDAARLQQVLWNLLQNAIKFTPENGRIIVRTRDGENGKLVIEVRDNGCGIEAGILPRIFNAFDQGDHGRNRALGGLGLGLAIAKAVVDMHGGSIAAVSEGTGKGACFMIQFPTSASQADLPDSMLSSDTKARDGAKSEPKASGLRILLVDDHADTLHALERLLKMSGHEVTTAGSVQAASGASSANPAARIDLLLSDIGLPDGSGMDVLRNVRSAHPNVKAVALTGYGMEQDIHACEQAGFNAHLTKPVDVTNLLDTIRRLMN